MLYGDEKIRQMARSILPSTSRYAATTRPLIHRAARREAKVAVRAMLREPWRWDEGGDEPDTMQLEIGPMVSRRRGADKLRHFERWAVERTREMPAELRLGHLAAVLPPGLIGDHAFSHLEGRRELMSEEQYRIRYPWRIRRRVRGEYLDGGEAAQLLRELLATPSGHRTFNRALKHGRVSVPAQPTVRMPAQAVRLLHGQHDVRAFLSELRRLFPLRVIADRFLRAFKETRNVDLALSRVGVIALSPSEHARLMR